MCLPLTSNEKLLLLSFPRVILIGQLQISRALSQDLFTFYILRA